MLCVRVQVVTMENNHMDMNENDLEELDVLLPIAVSIAELMQQQNHQYEEVERLMAENLID